MCIVISYLQQWSVIASHRRVTIGLLAIPGLLVAIFIAAMAVNPNPTIAQSSIVAAEQLAAHGIELKPVPPSSPVALVSAGTARNTAREHVGSPKEPDETYRILASATYWSPKRTAWLFLFAGGPGPGSAGPPEGAESRVFSADYTGVLIDDQTGEVLRWFQGGSY